MQLAQHIRLQCKISSDLIILNTCHICPLNELNPISLKWCHTLVRTERQLLMFGSNDIDNIALSSSLAGCLFCHLLSIQLFFFYSLLKKVRTLYETVVFAKNPERKVRKRDETSFFSLMCNTHQYLLSLLNET